ncbi:MAG: hypothetical protein RSD47_10825 [Romboutsia sp.]
MLNINFDFENMPEFIIGFVLERRLEWCEAGGTIHDECIVNLMNYSKQFVDVV